MSGLPRLTITGGPTLQQTSVQLDGWQIPGLTGVKVRFHLLDAARVEFTVAVDRVDIDEEALAFLVASVERTAEEAT